jgi:hypothetical protein
MIGIQNCASSSEIYHHVGDGMVGPNLVKMSETLLEVTVDHLNNETTFCDKASPICLFHIQLTIAVGLRQSDI